MKKVRSAVTAWLMVAKRLGVVKDVRKLIGVMVWRMKEEVAWERREDEEGKKRRKTGE